MMIGFMMTEFIQMWRWRAIYTLYRGENFTEETSAQMKGLEVFVIGKANIGNLMIFLKT